MPREDNEHKGHKYLCPNPNCKKAFSRPKIIKYQVCPVCQTLVNAAKAEGQGEIEASFATKKLMKRKKPKKPKADNSEGVALEVQPASVEPPLEDRVVPEKKRERSEEAMVLEQAQKSQQGKVEMPPVQHTKTLEEETVSQSSSNCQYGFGYLNQRKKGGQIPDMCMVCPKLLKCMLHDRYKKESVAEIKKLQAT